MFVYGLLKHTKTSFWYTSYICADVFSNSNLFLLPVDASSPFTNPFHAQIWRGVNHARPREAYRKPPRDLGPESHWDEILKNLKMYGS